MLSVLGIIRAFVLPMILIAAAVVVIVVISVKRSSAKKTGGNSSLLTLNATVVSKRYDYHGGNVRYCASFNVEGKGITELSIAADQFESLNEGDFGVLMYQGNKFFGFSKQ